MAPQVSSVRVETDSLGRIEVPQQALFGANTARGRDNFAISHRTIGHEPAFIKALAQVKKAAALANRDLGSLASDITEAIVAACDEVIQGEHLEWFVIDLLEGSGGTSINMNTNEVIANRALQILGHDPGDHDNLHPNDHVNCGQSTNDVVPTALKLACYAMVHDMLSALLHLSDSLTVKSNEFSDILRLGRTCLQDAQPMMLGQAFGGYASGLRRCAEKIGIAADDLLVVPLGGTAIGTGLGSVPGYRNAALRHLAEIAGVPVTGATDLFDGMQNADAFARLSEELRTCADLMSKIASDLILLSSGPTGGIGEIRLPPVQAGSSIMPGKVNPVMSMMMQQVAFVVTGNDLAVSMAALGGQLEINHFDPVMASRLFESLHIMSKGTRLFSTRCIQGIEAAQEKSLTTLMESSALATVMVPRLGYSQTSRLVKQSLTENRSFISLVIEQELLDEVEVMSILNCSARVE